MVSGRGALLRGRGGYQIGEALAQAFLAQCGADGG